MTYANVPYCAAFSLFLRCPPREQCIASRTFAPSAITSSNSPTAVRLLRCVRPSGALQAAPLTSLAVDTPDALWQGFWSVEDDSYYARCSSADGTEAWYSIADESSRTPARAPRVLALRPAQGRRYPVTRNMVLLRDVASGDPRRSILVGASRRTAASRPKRDAERAP